MDLNQIRVCRRPSCTCPCNAPQRRLEHPAEIAPRPITDQISVVGRRANTHRLGRAPEQVAQIVGQVLEGVGGAHERGLHAALAEDLVVDDVVMRRPSGALEGGVGLQEEIPVAGLGDAAVDDGAVLWVARAVGVLRSGGVEAGVVAFADDGDGEAGLVVVFRRAGWVDVFACFSERGEFVFEDEGVLAFGDAVAVDEDVLRENPVSLLPEAEP